MLTIQYKKIDELIPYARNSRTHSDAQVAQIAASIKEFGWTNPVLMDGDNGIIAGHGRVLAARVLGQTEIPTIELSHMTDIQKRAYIIADNKLSLISNWDEELLMLEIKDLEDAGYNLGHTGFSMEELDALNPFIKDEEYTNKTTDEARNLLMIECKEENELAKLFAEMEERGYQCKILT